jgi:WhiB family transcriptional regulator, redox-sensing transcriptional regulator
MAIGIEASIGGDRRGRSSASRPADVLEVLEWRPPWQRDALCREYVGRVNFFPRLRESVEPARAVCRRCLVREACLEFALEHDERSGVWGGLSARERRFYRGRLRVSSPRLGLPNPAVGT